MGAALLLLSDISSDHPTIINIKSSPPEQAEGEDIARIAGHNQQFSGFIPSPEQSVNHRNPLE